MRRLIEFFTYILILIFGLIIYIVGGSTTMAAAPTATHITGGSSEPFPYKYLSISEPPSWFINNLKNHSKYIISMPDSLTPSPSRLSIVKSYSSYDAIDKVTDLFTEEARMQANVFNRPSPLKFWETNQKLIYSTARRMRGYTPAKDPYFLREAIYQLTKEATTFSPLLSYSIYSLVAHSLSRPINILDPFGGWGDRMIGAIACDKVIHYTCVDANPALAAGYEKIKALSPEKVDFIISDILAAQIPQTPYDLIFTSPPYFDFETYVDHPSQSIKNKKNYADWLALFMRPVIEMLVTHMAPDGFFAIHVGDTNRAPTLVKDTTAILSEYLTYYNTINCQTEDKRPIPILVFKKK